ncbi:aconitase X [Clostridium sp. Cult3]|uniref:aconitase X n=1 Tax=Clostridium sp. Cult3 TaxID=2079004 RepID=UPI001F41A75F|nr:aconitase X [Clostridium sp. Cult3]
MYNYKMHLTPEEIEILEGKQGEVLGKIMKTLVMYGDTFGASKLVPVSSEYGHLVTSFGLSMMKPVYELMDEIIDAEIETKQKFTVDPRPLDFENVPGNIIQKIVFKIMYGKQKDYEEQLEKIGLLSKDGFTCTCYMDQVANIPNKGDILSWAESSAVVYANSVLGARCNRNSGIIEMFGSILGKVPYFGLLTDEGRKANWIVEIKTNSLPEAQVLGSAIGMKVMDHVPYIKNLGQYFDNELNRKAKDYLKDMGAATASNGAVGLFHVEGLTPEAKELGESLIIEDPNVYIIDDEELERVKNSYPVMWKNPDTKPKMCFIGCPHLSLEQMIQWTKDIKANLSTGKREKVVIPTILTASPPVLKEFSQLPEAKELKDMGISTSYICPLMYMNNPLCGKMPVITNSNKLRTYTTSRYYTDDEIVKAITRGEGI